MSVLNIFTGILEVVKKYRHNKIVSTVLRVLKHSKTLRIKAEIVK